VTISPDYSWDITDGTSVTVADGVITGGDTSGPSTIEVRMNYNNSIKDSVTYTNFTSVAEGSVRAVVYDAKTGELITGGKVYLNQPAKEILSADISGGIASFTADCSSGCDMHVFNDAYTYVSAFGITTRDIIIPLDTNVDLTIAQGVRGTIDYEPIPNILQELNLHLALVMFSIPGSLLDLNYTNLLGELEPVFINLGSIFKDYINLPTGLELYLQDERLTPAQYRAQGTPGLGTLWALGGYADLNSILEVVTGAMGGEEIDIPTMLAAFIPLFESFYHGIVTGFNLEPIAKVDGKPDYAAFENIEDNLKLTQPQTQNAEISVPELPNMPAGGCADTVFSIIGAMQSGAGFIPLGLGASQDLRDNADTADCLAGEYSDGTFMQAFAPKHSGISGYPYFGVAVALNLAALISGESANIELAASIYRNVDSSPTEVDYPDFTGFLNATWSEENKTVTTSDVSGATFYRVVFNVSDETSMKYHHVYWGNGASTINLADLPSGEDRVTGASRIVQAVRITGADYNGLLEFNSTNIDDMNDLVESFSMRYISE